MSKTKRIRQANRRAANVHRYTVQAGLTRCPYGSCRDCRTPEQQTLHNLAAASALTVEDYHRPITPPPVPPEPTPYRPHQRPPRRRHVHRSHPWRTQLWLAKRGGRSNPQEETA